MKTIMKKRETPQLNMQSSWVLNTTHSTLVFTVV